MPAEARATPREGLDAKELIERAAMVRHAYSNAASAETGWPESSAEFQASRSHELRVAVFALEREPVKARAALRAPAEAPQSLDAQVSAATTASLRRLVSDALDIISTHLPAYEVWCIDARAALDDTEPPAAPAEAPQAAQVERLREALALAEDVLSRFPYSANIWPNGTHPQIGIKQIRAALAATAQEDSNAAV